MRSQISYPLVSRVGFIGQLGILKYSADSVQETGVATLSGAPTASVAALNVRSLDYVSAPVMLGVSYDIVPKIDAQQKSAVTLEAGLSGNFAGTEKLQLNSTSAAYSFNLPVAQSSDIAGLLGLKVNAWQIGNGFNVTGIAQVEMGADTTSLRTGVNLVKNW